MALTNSLLQPLPGILQPLLLALFELLHVLLLVISDPFPSLLSPLVSSLFGLPLHLLLLSLPLRCSQVLVLGEDIVLRFDLLDEKGGLLLLLLLLYVALSLQ